MEKGSHSSIIFLWGMPGIGKSTVGRELAEICEIPFIDLDTFITELRGRAISDIFKLEGEEAFRQYEKKALEKIIPGNHALIVACGGGTPCRSVTHQLMSQSGLSVYLKGTQDLLFERLKANVETRPLLASKSEAQIREWIESGLEERGPWYEMADIVYEVKKEELSDTCHNLCNRIEQLKGKGV